MKFTPTQEQLDMKTYDDIKDIDISDDTFKLGYRTYRHDHRVATFFSSKFGVDVKAAFVAGGEINPTKTELEWGGANIMLFLANGNVIEMSNSEWAWITVTKGVNK